MNPPILIIIVLMTCNVWLLFLLLYDSIMETKPVRLIIGIMEVWKSLKAEKKENATRHCKPSAEPADVIGRSHFKMTSPRTGTDIPTQETATSEKAIEVSEDEITFVHQKEDTAVGKASNVQITDEQLDNVFTNIDPSELEYGKDEPDEGMYMPKASGHSFDDIGKAFTIAYKNDSTDEERREAGKVFIDLEDTELVNKLRESAKARVSNLIDHYMYGDQLHVTSEAVVRKPLVIPRNIEDFNIRDFV